MKDLTELELQIMELDERLRPIARRPVDITAPNWATQLTPSQHPLDEAGVRSVAEALLEEIIDEYLGCEEETRRAIRKLFASYRSFGWAATISAPPTTDEYFRRHLILFSINDQGTDARDAILGLRELCQQASVAGVSTAPIL